MFHPDQTPLTFDEFLVLSVAIIVRLWIPKVIMEIFVHFSYTAEMHCAIFHVLPLHAVEDFAVEQFWPGIHPTKKQIIDNFTYTSFIILETQKSIQAHIHVPRRNLKSSENDIVPTNHEDYQWKMNLIAVQNIHSRGSNKRN